MSDYDYDFFVIGGGSGGVRAARRAAAMGKRVAIAEEYRYGGTCVIRGCVPKKLFVYASQFPESFRDAAGYGWSVGESRFDWSTLMANKDDEIARLEKAYRTNVEKAGATLIDSRATLEDAHTIRLEATGETVTADQILLAVGGRPSTLPDLPGVEHCIRSNEAFHLPELPASILIVGGGYIAVEFANIFHGLGVDVTLLYRGEEILRGFDDDLRGDLHQAMEAKGLKVRCRENIAAVGQGEAGRLNATLTGGDVLNVDQVMLAVGREPNTENLGLEKAGIEVDGKGGIPVDATSRTRVDNIWAIGDVTHRVELTPVAIHEAMCLVETLYGDRPSEPDYDTIPTAVFSQPEIGTVGLGEAEAAERFDEIEVYRARFKPMKNTLGGSDERMMIKVIVDAASRRVVGAHVLGPDAGEMAQLLGIALKSGATKDQFDATMAVHPTAMEEIVTMYEPSYRVRGGERLAA